MAEPAVVPRLLDVQAAAAYLGGVSTWSVRALVEAGHLVPVRLPACRRPGESSRRLLFDVRDLDALIEKSKTAAPNSELSAAAVKSWSGTSVRRKRKGEAGCVTPFAG